MKVNAINVGWAGVGAFVLGTIVSAAATDCFGPRGANAGLTWVALILMAFGLFAGMGLAIAVGRAPQRRGIGILLGLGVAATWLVACAYMTLLLGLSGHCNT